MKKLLITQVTILLTVLNVFATQIVVTETNGYESTYTDLLAAINAASDGSTIYIPGGTHAINSSTIISKKLHFRGNGYNPISAVAGQTTVVEGESFTFTREANGSTFEGIYFDNKLIMKHFLTDVSGTFDLNFSRCYLTQRFSAIEATNSDGYEYITNSHIYFNECVINDISLSDAIEEVYVSNSILTNVGSYNHFQQVDNGYIKNCICFNGLSLDYSSRNILIENSIIMGHIGGVSEPNDNVIVQNCLLRQGYSIDENATSISNLFQEWESIFIDEQDGSYDYTDNLHLKPGSLAIGNGSMGTDIGIYGGINPWKDNGVPTAPHVYNKSVSVKNNAQGEIQAIYQVKAQDW